MCYWTKLVDDICDAALYYGSLTRFSIGYGKSITCPCFFFTSYTNFSVSHVELAFYCSCRLKVCAQTIEGLYVIGSLDEKSMAGSSDVYE